MISKLLFLQIACVFANLFFPWTCTALLAADQSTRDTVPSTMLAGDWLPADPHQLDFSKLPRLPSEHVVISDVRARPEHSTTLNKQAGGVNQHNYLAHHAGQFWAMWSDGPGIEDRVGQRVKYATSPDGLQWSQPRYLTPIPPDSGPDSPHYGTRTEQGFRWISRGFWIRDGELLALASLDEAAGFFGQSLELRAFRFDTTINEWRDAGVVYTNTINNFPPLKLRTGEWLMSRRMHDYKTTGVHFLRGGKKSLSDWQSFPVLGSASELKAEEPDWWILPDQRLAAIFRDNRRSGFVYRSISADDGRTWSQPIRTNFPDATSKLSGLRLRDGRYVLVSNPNPKKRDPLTLSVSEDGLVFTKMFYLVGGRHVDYPHVIEHDGSLFVAFAGGKQTVEVLKIDIGDIDRTPMRLVNSQPISSTESVPVELEKEANCFSFERKADRLLIGLDEHPITEFVFADPQILRPYFSNVRLPSGLQVTRAHPPRAGVDAVDHETMHPGIWMGFGDISGHDFWRNKARMQHLRFTQEPTVQQDQLTFATESRLFSGQDEALCLVRNFFSLTPRPSGWLLSWKAEFLADTQPISFGDQEEMGLGVRMATGLTEKNGGRIVSSTGLQTAQRTWGQAAAWCDYSGTIQKKSAGILLMASPGNFRESWWHNRDYGVFVANPFGRQAMRQGEPSSIGVPQGHSLTLHFGVLIHEGSDVDLAAEFESFAK